MRTISIFFLIFVLSTNALAQWTGPTHSHIGATESYTFTIDPGSPDITGLTLSATKGTVSSQHINANLRSVDIKVSWTTAGTGTLSGIYATDYAFSISVAVISCPTLGAPTGLSSGSTICYEAPVTISATPGTNGNSIQWYEASTGGSVVLTGATKSPIMFTSLNFYAVSYDSVYGCAGTTRSGPISFTVHPEVPSQIIWQEEPIYGIGSTSFSATHYGGTTVHWLNESGDSLLATGLGFTTPVLYGPKSYLVSDVDNTTGCESDRTILAVPIYPAFPLVSVKTEIVRVGGISGDGLLYGLTQDQKPVTFTYADGLGRTREIKSLGASPSGKNNIIRKEYDDNGRTTTDYLPYTAAGDSTFQLLFGSTQHQFYMNTPKVAADTKAYATSKFENSSLGRQIEQGSPGSATQAGSGHTTRQYYSFGVAPSGNDSSDVRQFAADASSTQYFAAGVLSSTTSVDANGNKDIAWQDAMGNTVCRKQQVNDTIAGTFVGWLQTYYIFNDVHKLVYVIPPAGYVALSNNSWTASAAIKEQFFHQFRYDSKGRLTQKKTPGQSWTYYAYDKFDRLVLTQDGILRPLNKWAFVKYDYAGRKIISGLYTNATVAKLSSVQKILTGLYGSGAWYEERSNAVGGNGYSNQSFPTANGDGSPVQVLSVNYYDEYDFNHDGTADYRYDSTVVPGRTSQWKPNGLSTGSLRIVLGTSTWLKSVTFYDSADNVIQTRSNNYLSATVDNQTTIVYDYEGKMIKTITYHNAGGTNQKTITQLPVFDSRGRLYQMQQQIDSDSLRVLVQYEYNELGQVVDKKLHKIGSSFLQSVDYRYTIRGQLKSINNAQLGINSKNNDETNDFFGMEMLYDSVESGLNSTAYYNGNLSGVKWKSYGGGTGTAGQRSYNFSYDASDKLKHANFNKYGTSWDLETGTLNEWMKYDHNGNIVNSQRNQNLVGLSGYTPTNTPQIMDNLTYTYSLGGSASGNRLGKVTDASAIAGGFSDVNTSGVDDYTYDSAGNILSDLNKGIDSIKYNVIGKAILMKFHDGRSITYTYDGSGTKLQMTIATDSTSTTTNYVDGFVYQGTVLDFFSSPEGRVVNNGTGLEYQYTIADNQGNTRVLFTSAAPVPSVLTATFEDAASEAPNFDYYGGWIYLNTSAAHTGSYCSDIQGVTNSQISLAKSYHVYAGDKFELNGWAMLGNKCCSYSGNLPTFATALLTAFHLSAPAPGEAHTASAAINSIGTMAAAGDGYGSTDETDIRGFFTILVFDKNYNLVDTRYQQITADVSYENIDLQYTAVGEGYIYAYISQEDVSITNLYIDDVTMTYTPSRIVQSNEYYPFGLQTANSWTRAGATANQALYDQGAELNTTTGFYDLSYRNYDASLGRFFQVDPMAHVDHYLTPYHFAGNNPTNNNDPSGALDMLGSIGRYGEADAIAESSWNGSSWSEDYDGGYSGGGGTGSRSNFTFIGASFTTTNPTLIAAILNAFKAGMSPNDIYSTLQQAGKNFDHTFNLALKGYLNILNKRAEAARNNLAKNASTLAESANNLVASTDKFAGIDGSQGNATSTLKILNASTSWDWFLQTTSWSSGGTTFTIKNAVLIYYNTDKEDWGTSRYGQVTDLISRSQVYDQSGIINPSNGEQSSGSPEMNQLIQDAIDYHCGGCVTAPSMIQRYFDFILSPSDQQSLNRLSSGAPHR